MGSKGSRARAALRHPAFPVVLAGVALGLFCWPLLRTPPPDAPLAYAFMLGAWAVVIAVLFLMARSGESSAPSGGEARGDPHG